MDDRRSATELIEGVQRTLRLSEQTVRSVAGRRMLERHGLGSVPGGRHHGWGTANSIVPLGPAYVELVAVVDEAEAQASDVGRRVAAGVTGGDRL